MHPGAQLLAGLAFLMAIPRLENAGLFVLTAGLLWFSASKLPHCVLFLWRMRWLLLAAWLVFAYNTPGESYAGWWWAPTYEGMGEANLHMWRIVVLLLGLKRCLLGLGKGGLQAGLWSILAPLREWGIPVRSLVVRLALVLENVDLSKGQDWRDLLLVSDAPSRQETVCIELAPWCLTDLLLVALAWVFCLGVWLW